MNLIDRYILSNLKIKLISIAMAIIIWLAVTSIGEERKSIYIPVFISGLKKDYTLVRVDPEGIFLTLRGPIASFRNLNEREFKVTLNAQNLSPGNHSYIIEKKDVSVPRGLKIEDIHPHSVTVDIDRLVRKRVKLALRLAEDIERDYSLQYYSPKYVELEGAERVLSFMSSIDLTIDRETLERFGEEADIPIRIHNPGIKRVSPEFVAVKIARRVSR